MLRPQNFNPRHPYGWRQLNLIDMLRPQNFNPRHPYGWRPITSSSMGLTLAFQSTPPIRVATCQGRSDLPAGSISIHATHTGGDAFCLTTSRRCAVFQSTPPIRVATPMTCERLQSLEFQSTPPIRVATCSSDTRCQCCVFQSTPPIRVATRWTWPRRSWLLFQSTPPIRVATFTPMAAPPIAPDFNPRHPYGWRP